MYYRIGLDIGSTTIKLVVIDDKDKIIYQEYKRHFSDIKSTIIELIENCYEGLGNIFVKFVLQVQGSVYF